MLLPQSSSANPLTTGLMNAEMAATSSPVQKVGQRHKHHRYYQHRGRHHGYSNNSYPYDDYMGPSSHIGAASQEGGGAAPSTRRLRHLQRSQLSERLMLGGA